MVEDWVLVEAVVVVTSTSPNGFFPQHTVVSMQFLNYRRETACKQSNPMYIQPCCVSNLFCVQEYEEDMTEMEHAVREHACTVYHVSYLSVQKNVDTRIV